MPQTTRVSIERPIGRPRGRSVLLGSPSCTSEQRKCLWIKLSSFLPQSATQRRQRLSRAILASLGPLPANDDRAYLGLLLGTQPRAPQRGEQGRYDSSTAKALMERHAQPLPRPRRLLEQNVHAVRADPSRINVTAIMHAPQERVMLEDRPLRAFESSHSCTERAFDGGPPPRVLALLELRRPDALCHGSQRHPTIPQRMC